MIILSGPSASGKTEVAKILQLNYGIAKVVTHTTRPMRCGERDGIDYHFVSKEEFHRLKEAGSFVETTEYSGNCYGTSKKEIADDKVLIVDPNGMHAFQSLGDPRIVIFRLEAAPEIRFNRMMIRGDELPLIKERLERDVEVFSDAAFTGVKNVIATDFLTIPDVAARVFKIYRETLASL